MAMRGVKRGVYGIDQKVLFTFLIAGVNTGIDV